MTEHEYEKRLRELGRQPIDEATKAAHLRRIQHADVGADTRRRRRFGAISVAAAGVVGFLAGSTGLAMADALPDPAQEVAHDVLGAVQVDVPAGNRGACVSEAAKLKDKEAKRAAKDACPEGGPDDSGTGEDGDDTGPGTPPGKSGEAPGRSDQAPGHNRDGAPGKGSENSNHPGDPCRGRPPWAGPMTKAEREAAKASASRDACPTDETDDTAAVDDPADITPSESNDAGSTADASGPTSDDSGDG